MRPLSALLWWGAVICVSLIELCTSQTQAEPVPPVPPLVRLADEAEVGAAADRNTSQRRSTDEAAHDRLSRELAEAKRECSRMAEEHTALRHSSEEKSEHLKQLLLVIKQARSVLSELLHKHSFTEVPAIVSRLTNDLHDCEIEAESWQ